MQNFTSQHQIRILQVTSTRPGEITLWTDAQPMVWRLYGMVLHCYKNQKDTQ